MTTSTATTTKATGSILGTRRCTTCKGEGQWLTRTGSDWNSTRCTTCHGQGHTITIR